MNFILSSSSSSGTLQALNLQSKTRVSLTLPFIFFQQATNFLISSAPSLRGISAPAYKITLL